MDTTLFVDLCLASKTTSRGPDTKLVLLLVAGYDGQGC